MDCRANVLLYEASCMVNGIPVTLHVTYGYLSFSGLLSSKVHPI
jgi:hypothetical protein